MLETPYQEQALTGATTVLAIEVPIGVSTLG